MTICTVEIDVAADRERTFAYLADAANQPQWRHDVATCELTGGAAGTVGAVYRQTKSRPGGRVPHHRRGGRFVDHLGVRRGHIVARSGHLPAQ